MTLLSKQTYIDGILQGDVLVLSRAITLLESTKPEHNVLARQVLERVLLHTGKSKRIGITGVPGVGKSTFIEKLGLHITKEGGKLAVLAIDPSSQLSKGSILGDKTRMEQLAKQSNVFIRPTAAGSALGGVGRNTRETIMLCEAAGFNHIIIETVGVGQNEISIHSMVDCFLLLLLPNAGDELQGIKRGIMEMAEIIIVNKAYDTNKALKSSAKKTMQELKHALHYFPEKEHSWLTKVNASDAYEGYNMQQVYQIIDEFFIHQELKGYLAAKRNEQNLYWYTESVNKAVLHHFLSKENVKEMINKHKQELLEGKISSFEAADQLLRHL
ncbi:MAG: methylmalonyl Co-A mutase-associated GTPase MeaB [Chitinophagales bacterium]|nr:methylmalonyl Co-A mutase-associated GTPase MeaB [Chitinophagales bacterium]